MKPIIAYFHSSATAASMQKIAGVCQAAHYKGWSVVRFDIQSRLQVKLDILSWQPLGCIVDAVACPRKVLSDPVFRKTPSVFVDCNPRQLQADVYCLYQDAEAIARAAANELTRHELASYAFTPWPGHHFWSETRCRAFVDQMAARGIPVNVFRPGIKKFSRQSVITSLCKWLCTLPMPVGIFTAADALSEQVLEAATALGLSIPKDIVLIGVDNDEFFCENTRPTLSSISQDFNSIGERAVEILEQRIQKPTLLPTNESMSRVRVVTRNSTRRAEKHDSTVSKALDLIRAQATTGMTAADVLSVFTCSRRMAEQRFHDFTGHSILEEIHAVQIEQAMKLIRNPLIKLTAIPGLCGHQTAPYFQKLFLTKTGMTMSAYRFANSLKSKTCKQGRPCESEDPKGTGTPQLVRESKRSNLRQD